jgi:hypothetical protein
MRTLSKIILGSICLAHTTATWAQSAGDREAVTLVMQTFIRSFEKSDLEVLRGITRADGSVVGYSTRQNQVVSQSIESWSKGFTGKPADDEAQRKRSFEILDVSATGAVSKMLFDYPGWNGVDYIALSKIDGKWMIISKSHSWKAKPAATQ